MWRQIVLDGVEFSYEVSDDGQVRNSKTGQILKFEKLESGYYRVKLYNQSTNFVKKILVHRLVATMFIPNPENLHVINHKDCDKTNNHVSNLEWCTQSHNMKEAHKHNLITMKFGEEHHNAKYTTKQIRMVCELLAEGTKSFKKIAKETGVMDEQFVSYIYRGKTWRHISSEYRFPERTALYERFFNSVDRALLKNVRTKEIVKALCKYMTKKQAEKLCKRRKKKLKENKSFAQHYTVYFDYGIEIFDR